MEHATCCGPTQVQVESGLGFHTSPIWRIFPSESLQYGADMKNKSKRVDQLFHQLISQSTVSQPVSQSFSQSVSQSVSQ